jgi:hypothetical protein
LSLFFRRILPACKEARVSVGSETSIASFTGLNRYFVLCTTESLAFGGGGHFALHIDAELLNGSSGACETYGNCCLAQTEDFTLKDVEVLQSASLI